MRQLSNWLRIYNYIQDYYSAVYKIYAGLYIACYPVTYYLLDLKNSVYDDNELLSGSYEKYGVGSLSGIRWKKIYMLPIYALQPIRPAYSPDERGVVYEGGTSFLLPSTYGIKPNHRDVIDLSYTFLDDQVKFQDMLYVVKSIEVSHQSEFFQLYQLTLDNAPFDLTLLDKQVSEYLTFFDLEKRVLPSTNVSKLVRIHNKMGELVSELNTIFDKPTGFYLENL